MQLAADSLCLYCVCFQEQVGEHEREREGERVREGEKEREIWMLCIPMGT